MKDIIVYGYCLGSIYATIAATHFTDISGVIIDRGVPDLKMSADRLTKSFRPTDLFDQVFPIGKSDVLPNDANFIQPKIPFVSNGMSNIKRIDDILEAQRNYNIKIAPFFFLYSHWDEFVPMDQTNALISHYLKLKNIEFEVVPSGKSGAINDENGIFTSKKTGLRVADVNRITKGHQEFFMKNEPYAAREMKRFIDSL